MTKRSAWAVQAKIGMIIMGRVILTIMAIIIVDDGAIDVGGVGATRSRWRRQV